MPKKQNPFIFITIITVVSSFLLSLASTQLASRQAFNVEVDKKKNILKCIGIDVNSMTSNEIIDTYKSGIKELVLDVNGVIQSQLNFDDLELTLDKVNGYSNYTNNGIEYLPLFKSATPEAIILPISGKGLWSTLFGYFALDSDFNTVKGITFYNHGETPGLGAEIEKDWFQNNFLGKKINNQSGELVSIEVVKGKSGDNIHAVDGISGATITSRGVTDLLKHDLNKYSVYLHKQNIGAN
jgi:Na+-transporting NADH:ubiquinone oxidoreductase subunit C